jgi:hypothetical protein
MNPHSRLVPGRGQAPYASWCRFVAEPKPGPAGSGGPPAVRPIRDGVPRYFPALADVAARRGPAVARILVRQGFPHHAVAPATLRAGEACLAGTAFPASVRRPLAGHLDDLRRALQVRSCPA